MTIELGRTAAAALAAAAVLSLAAGCGSSSKAAATPAASSPAATTSTSTVASGTVKITIKNFMFTPMSVTVKPGTTVTWTNTDSATHTVTSSTSLFNSGDLTTGKSFSYTFTKPGTYDYLCQIHQFMTASIIVS